MSDRDDPLVVVDESSTERPLVLPPICRPAVAGYVLFPNSFMPLAVAREASVRLIDEPRRGRMIGVFTQRERRSRSRSRRTSYPIGTVTHIHKMFKLPDGSCG
jgi:ATP-dependent Lon protease